MLTSLFHPSEWFTSAAEDKVNQIYASPFDPQKRDGAVTDNVSASDLIYSPVDPDAIPLGDTPDADGGKSISTFERIIEAVTPNSYGESIVAQIYGGDPKRTLLPDPEYDVKDLSSPNVYVRTKGAVKDAVSSWFGFTTKTLYFVVGFVLVAIVLYAAVPAFIRR